MKPGGAMKKHYGWMVVVLLIACMAIAACGQGSEATTEKEHPVTVEQLDGADPTRETLTEDAAKRLDIQTAVSSEAEVGGVKRTIIPYASVIYDTEGATWVYLNPKPLTFV